MYLVIGDDTWFDKYSLDNKIFEMKFDVKMIEQWMFDLNSFLDFFKKSKKDTEIIFNVFYYASQMKLWNFFFF